MTFTYRKRKAPEGWTANSLYAATSPYNTLMQHTVSGQVSVCVCVFVTVDQTPAAFSQRVREFPEAGCVWVRVPGVSDPWITQQRSVSRERELLVFRFQDSLAWNLREWAFTPGAQADPVASGLCVFVWVGGEGGFSRRPPVLWECGMRSWRSHRAQLLCWFVEAI